MNWHEMLLFVVIGGLKGDIWLPSVDCLAFERCICLLELPKQAISGL